VFDQIFGVIAIASGIYAWMLARGVLPRRTEKPAEWQEWREQWSGKLNWLSPVLVVYGALRLFEVL
jgi:hypothetical protein